MTNKCEGLRLKKPEGNAKHAKLSRLKYIPVLFTSHLKQSVFFQELLQGFIVSRKIKARSKWKDIYPFLCDDERYLSMLSNPGSNPLELFWDAVDALDQQLDEKIAVIENAVGRHNAKVDVKDQPAEDGAAEGEKRGEAEAKGFAVGPETTEEEFKSIIRANADDAVSTLSSTDLHVIYRAVSYPFSLQNVFDG